jgi:hypothetical protein
MVAHQPLPTFGVRSQPQLLDELVSLSEECLSQFDIAQVNLICALGLPGTEWMDLTFCLSTIDQMAEQVGRRTRCGFNRFAYAPERWDHSPGIFRIHVLVSTLQKEFGIRYNPAKIPLEVPLLAQDTFLFGIIQGQGGTCGSLPVLFAAVGRRLGYPLKLVSAACTNRWMHLFVRWDDPAGERFNIEVSNEGFSCPPDDYYRHDNYKSPPGWEESGSILKSQLPREELAGFLNERAACWEQVGQKHLELESRRWAAALAPDNVCYRFCLDRLQHHRHEFWWRKKPAYT